MQVHLTKRCIAGLLTCFLATGLTGGCSRTQHRLAADREVYRTIAERNCDPRWSQTELGIDMDPRSRFHDPYNPDCSPMPRDDPASHRYMHCVDGMKGWKHWDRNGFRAELENSRWRSSLANYAQLNEQGEVRLDVDSALRLAYLHSPLNQNALETLYLTSLDVTGERFRLDTQFFGGTGVGYRHQGELSPAVIGFNPTLNRYVVSGPFDVPEINRLEVNSDLGATRRFATAGEVLVGFANSFAFEFTGENVNLASTLANFSFIQPLLRGAGRDIALEQLTLVERRLLANLRAYAQFRQGFYTQVVIGELGVNGPQRFGTSTNLQSFSGFGGVNGYLGLLQQVQQIRNSEELLRLQLRTLDRLEALYENELIDIVQVDQFRQNIEVTRSNLLDQQNLLELAVDRFSTQTLGLPSDLPLDLDQDLIRPFQLIAPEVAQLSDELIGLQRRVGDIGELSSLSARINVVEGELSTLGEQDFVDADSTIRNLKAVVDSASRQMRTETIGRSGQQSSDTTADADQADGLATEFAQSADKLDTLLDELTEEDVTALVDSNMPWMEETLNKSRRVVESRSEAIDLEAAPERALEDAELLIEATRELLDSAREDVAQMETVAAERERLMNEDEKMRFRDDRNKLVERLGDLESGRSGFAQAVREFEAIREAYSEENRVNTIRSLTGWIQSYLQLVERLALVPAQARLEVITVEEVDLDAEAAFQIALANRLDFMNGRAALVDQWRAIQVAADALQSNLSITGDGDVRTATNNPVDFRASTARLRLGVEFDAPLARLLERNGYRESLISYQRSRRDLIQSRDELQLGLRALLRTLQQRRLQLEIQRRAVTIALRRVDQTQLSLLTPPPQGQPGVRPQINPTTAINLLAAQSALQNSQNSFLAAWLGYYAAEIRLYRELGIMQLDPGGRWIDSPLREQSLSGRGSESDLELLPPPVPIEELELDSATGAVYEGDEIAWDAMSRSPVMIETIPPTDFKSIRIDGGLVRTVQDVKVPKN